MYSQWWRVLAKKIGRVYAPASKDPYHIYVQNLQFSLPYLLPDQILDTFFMTVAASTVALNIIYEGLLLMVLSINDKKVAFFLKNIPNSRLECKNYTPFMTKVARIDALVVFMTKRLKNHPPLGRTYLYGPCKGVPPPPGVHSRHA